MTDLAKMYRSLGRTEEARAWADLERANRRVLRRIRRSLNGAPDVEPDEYDAEYAGSESVAERVRNAGR